MAMVIHVKAINHTRANDYNYQSVLTVDDLIYVHIVGMMVAEVLGLFWSKLAGMLVHTTAGGEAQCVIS